MIAIGAGIRLLPPGFGRRWGGQPPLLGTHADWGDGWRLKAAALFTREVVLDSISLRERVTTPVES